MNLAALLAAHLGPHATFIVLSYAFAALIIAALIIWVIADHRRQRATLKALDDAGITRRSARASQNVAHQP